MRLREIHGRHCSVESMSALGPSASNLFPNDNRALTDTRSDSLEEQSLTPSKSRPRLIIWTAADEAGLKRLAAALHGYSSGLSFCSSLSHARLFENLAYTLASKRSLLPWRSHLVCETVEGLVRSLKSIVPEPIRFSGTEPALGFIFTGQGAQWYAMGRELFAYLTFKESFEQADSFLRTLGCNWSLIGERPFHIALLAHS